MKQDESSICDFCDDDEAPDDSYLSVGDAHGVHPWQPPSRPAGHLLKKVRLNLGLTQDQMGDLMKVTGRNYNNYERERVQNVPAPALQRLADHTGIAAAHLLTGRSPSLDYVTILDEVYALQKTVWDLCQRPDGKLYGMNTCLSPEELRDVIKALLSDREYRRYYEIDPYPELTKNDILETVATHTDFYKDAGWEWARDNDPEYYGFAPFPCPAMYVVPRFQDMAEYRRYSELRCQIEATLTSDERTLYSEWLSTKPKRSPEN
ncbi:helix-turn-helix domain-containing protein [Paracoccus denitrificans]|uniref:helix-turn-helix domain-containing protein n=1 Tax=Paracoccus denitrificans TaxID=266 RepID=UPI00131A0453|nr:helix-turn-helix transcriptional regulator [Paracoccus denitrificans]